MAGRPTTERAEPKLALENAAERMLDPGALQLTTFLARLYFLQFGLLIDLHSMTSQEMHGSGTRLVNTTDGAQLEIERDAKGSGTVNCHVFIISDAQFNILNRQLLNVQY